MVLLTWIFLASQRVQGRSTPNSPWATLVDFGTRIRDRVTTTDRTKDQTNNDTLSTSASNSAEGEPISIIWSSSPTARLCTIVFGSLMLVEMFKECREYMIDHLRSRWSSSRYTDENVTSVSNFVENITLIQQLMPSICHVRN